MLRFFPDFRFSPFPPIFAQRETTIKTCAVVLLSPNQSGRAPETQSSWLSGSFGKKSRRKFQSLKKNEKEEEGHSSNFNSLFLFLLLLHVRIRPPKYQQRRSYHLRRRRRQVLVNGSGYDAVHLGGGDHGLGWGGSCRCDFLRCQQVKNR